jgi:hypothetical protein
MKPLSYLILFTFISCRLLGQETNFSVEIHYGPQANFFVRGYDEEQYAQRGMTAFFKKNLIGMVGGADITWRLGARSRIGFGYSRSVNSKAISYFTTLNSIAFSIVDFRIRHVTNFYQLYYSIDFRKPRSEFSLQPGLFYTRPSQQEITVMPLYSAVTMDERNYKNSRLEEGGVFLGVAYSHRIDTRFSLGIKSRLYYTLSTNSMESLTLTPSLTYHFGTKQIAPVRKDYPPDEKKNTAFFELGGNGLFGSVNYERQLTKKPGLSARMGVGFYSEYAAYVTFPVGINYLFALKKKGAFIDAGLGVTWTTGNPSDNLTHFIPTIGYRKYTANNIMLRASITPVINEEAFTPWIGLSIGKQF